MKTDKKIEEIYMDTLKLTDDEWVTKYGEGNGYHEAFETLIQEEREEAVREYSKWFTKYFQEGHKYIAWVENGELKLVDENHIELTENMLNETYLQSLDKGDE